MTSGRLIELLRSKIEEANQNIATLQKMQPKTSRFVATFMTYIYDSEEKQKALNNLSTWQQVVQQILGNYFGIRNVNYRNFEYTIIEHKEGFDVKNETIEEYRSGIAAINGIIEGVKLLAEDDPKAEVAMKQPKQKKIFISHSSKDKNFIHALVSLLNSLGFGEDDIFCTSEKGYWIKKGNFFNVIKEQFEKNDLYVIFIQSPRFYSSPVSLNEMGAAWVLHSEYYSFLTKDMEFDKMSAVVNNHEIACKVDSSEAKDRLDDWQRDVLQFFGKPAVTNWSIWEQNRDEFLRKVRRMSPKKKSNKEDLTKITDSGVALTDEDIKRLKAWVESGNDAMYQAWYSGGSAYFMLGGGDGYSISSGREMAEWRGFMNRLLTLCLIELVGYTKDGKHPEYKLTERAYAYSDKMVNHI